MNQLSPEERKTPEPQVVDLPASTPNTTQAPSSPPSCCFVPRHFDWGYTASTSPKLHGLLREQMAAFACFDQETSVPSPDKCREDSGLNASECRPQHIGRLWLAHLGLLNGHASSDVSCLPVQPTNTEQFRQELRALDALEQVDHAQVIVCHAASDMSPSHLALFNGFIRDLHCPKYLPYLAKTAPDFRVPALDSHSLCCWVSILCLFLFFG